MISLPHVSRIVGTKVPGTNYQLDPIRGAFNIGTQIRWLDFNDCFLAAEWGHPSDNLGAILAVADHLARQGHPITVRDILEAMIKAHEIQGQLALLNSFNRVGLDHVVLVKVASTAVVSKMLYVHFSGTSFLDIEILIYLHYMILRLAASTVLRPLMLSHKLGQMVSLCEHIATRQTRALVNPGRRGMLVPVLSILPISLRRVRRACPQY